ncbi:hypothetical protein OK074_3930 [Actinobacteria bacterium OK074]|nr:hypothetical protein OK074_3930 [Actinobacteria bacterium OK074]
MRRAAVAALAAALLTLSGCSGEGVHDDSAAPTPPAGTESGRSVRHGMTLPSWARTDYDSPVAGTYLRDIRATGADWIVFTPTWYQDRRTDDGMHTTEETASDGSLRRIVRRAHRAGFKVLLKPHVDLRGGGDRAGIRPGDPAAWFTAYRRFITHYADLAAAEHVEQLAVGTELAGTSGDTAAWTKVIGAVRERYGGPLTYAANFDEYSGIGFWRALDVVGIDAYWPVAGKATTDPDVLRRGWAPVVRRLAAFAARQDRRILFTEAGYTSQHGTATAPYSWTVGTRPDGAEQAAAYRALLDAFEQRTWWAGVCWWMWDDWPDSGEIPRRLTYSPHGKPAEQVLRDRWTT